MAGEEVNEVQRPENTEVNDGDKADEKEKADVDLKGLVCSFLKECMYIPNSDGTGKTFSGNRFSAEQFEEALKKGQALYKVEKAKACKVSEDIITVPNWTFTHGGRV